MNIPSVHVSTSLFGTARINVQPNAASCQRRHRARALMLCSTALLAGALLTAPLLTTARAAGLLVDNGVVLTVTDNQTFDGIFVGNGAEGTLTITDGGVADAANDVVIGLGAGSQGTVTVSSPGSKLTAGANIFVGDLGNGALSIIEGGTTRAAGRISIGNKAGSQGAVTISGAGSGFTADGALQIGSSGIGTLTLAEGGVAKAASVAIASNASSTGVLNIGAASGEAAAGAGLLDTASLFFGNGSGTLVFNHNATDYSFAPDVSGHGTLLQEAGFTRLLGDFSGFTGKAVISGGTLSIDTDTGPDVTVAKGATLTGTGSAGNVVFEDGSLFAVTLGETFLNTKTLSIGKDVFVTVDAGSVAALRPGETYTIVDWSDAPVAGEFAGVFTGVDEDFTFLDAAIVQAGSSFILTLDRNDLTFADIAQTRNQKATASGIESLGAGAVYDAVLASNATDARTGFDQLSGEIHASIASGLFADSRLIREALNARMRASFDPLAGLSLARQDDLMGAPDLGPVRHWLQAFGETADIDGNGNAAALAHDTSGFLVGSDVMVKDWQFGFAAGFSHSNFAVDDRASSADSDNFHLGFYDAGDIGPVSLRSGLTYSYQQVDSSRRISFGGLDQHLSASYNSHTLQAFGEAGYQLDTAVARLEPFAGMAGTMLINNGYHERGGSAALDGDSDTQTLLSTSLGLRADRAITVAGRDVLVHGAAAWRHAFGDREPSINQSFAGGSAFTVFGAPVSADTAFLEAGLNVGLSDHANLDVGYSGIIGSDETRHGVSARLDLRF